MAGFYERRIFPVLLDRATKVFAGDRKRLLAQARGRVLEVGIGTGATLPHYGAVDELIGVEPVEEMLGAAESRAQTVSFPVTLKVGSAEALPADDNSVDTVVCSLVFCTVGDPAAAAAEMLRVLKPDGQLLILEHVRAQMEKTARWQDRLNPVWRPFACGCNINRDTAALLTEAGFDTSQARVYRHPKVMGLMGTILEGVVKPAG